MTACRNLETLLSLYANAELEAGQAATIVAHLEICSGCRQRVAAYQEMAAQLKTLAAPALPPSLFTDFHDGVRGKIAAGSNAQSRLLGLFVLLNAHFRRRRLAFAIAAFVILITVPVLLTQRFHTPSQSRAVLIKMLEERNWLALYSAIQDRETGSRFLNEPVPVELLREALIELVQAQSRDRLVRAGLTRILAAVKTRENAPLVFGRSAQILGKVTAKGFEPATRKNSIAWNPEASLKILLQSGTGQTMTIRELLLRTTMKGNRL